MTPEQAKRVNEIIAKHQELERDGNYSYPNDIMELKDIIDQLAAENEALKKEVKEWQKEVREAVKDSYNEGVWAERERNGY